MDFSKLFKQISPEELSDNAFVLAGKVFPVITAGGPKHYNAMTGSGGGFVVLFRKPVTLCILRSDRYTLELIEKKQTYTLSYFPDEYKEQLMLLGSKSGRDGGKMKEISLTGVQTPGGNMAFKEARIIIECKLMQITAVGPEDFYSREAVDYINEANKEAKTRRKYVFGEITGVWVRKHAR